jgi:DNA-binding CsgD family transcriptional regulator
MRVARALGVPAGSGLRQINPHDGAYEQVLDLVAMPVCGIGDRLQLTFANRAARAELALSQWLTTVGGQLALAPRVCESGLGRIALASVGRGVTSTVLVSDPVRGCRAILRTIAVPREQRTYNSTVGVVCLQTLDAASCRVRDVAEVFHLTAAEERFLELLANGQSILEIARQLRITVNTARAHLKSVFRKTGRHSQAHLLSLVQKIATLSEIDD